MDTHQRNEQISQSIINNDVVALRQALEHAKPNGFINACVLHVAETGRIDLLKEFIACGMPTRIYNKALEQAAQTNQLECVQLLAHVSDFNDKDMKSLNGAAYNGHAEVIAFLLPLTHQEDKDRALILAAKKNHTKCVTILSASANAQFLQSLALQYACRNEDYETFYALYDVSDPQKALKQLMENKEDRAAEVLQQYINTRQKNIIEQHMPDKHSRLNKKI